MSEAALWLTNRAVLIVEDDALIAMGLVSYLEEFGAEVTWVTSVPQAVRHIETRQNIDVAIVDLNLDGEMSTSVLDQLISNGVFTILCTGYDITSIEERFKRLPRSEKPFTQAKIRTLVTAGL